MWSPALWPLMFAAKAQIRIIEDDRLVLQAQSMQFEEIAINTSGRGAGASPAHLEASRHLRSPWLVPYSSDLYRHVFECQTRGS